MKTNGNSALASVIIPCWNQLQFTQLCIRSLVRHTRAPWELVVIDNGSSDGTAAYLAGVRDASAVPVTIIVNATNKGFPAAINQGLQAARGDYLVLLNNDAVVTDAWLDQLIALTDQAGAASRIGLAGPMSNYVSPPQLVEEVPYRDMQAMERFARQWRDRHRGQWSTVPKLSGFCLLMKRAVYAAIGGLDERFGLGFFDDDDLAERARRAGFELAVAHDLFVHHFGSRTFAGAGIDTGALLAANAEQFARKWGESVPRGRAVALQPWAANKVPAGGNNPAMPAGRAKVSLTMIVRNEEENLPQCLGSVRGVFDEIVVVDTGSTDRTRAIALEFGANVVEFAWIDDFAAARNASLAAATGDYALWLDADDVVEPEQRVRLRKLLGGLSTADAAAYVVKCVCDPSTDGSGGDTVVDHVRLFPLLEGVRWTYRVHEQIMPSLRRAGVPVRWTDLAVRHTGYRDPALRERKLERDWRILLEELAAGPNEPFVLFNLGSIALERDQWPEALHYLRRSLSRSAPDDSITRKLFAQIARCHQMLGDLEAALRVCVEGLSFHPEDAELWFRRAVLHRHRGQWNEAETCWRRILDLRRPEQFCSVDRGIYGHLTRRNLAALARARGDHAEAMRQWEAVLAECPGDPDAVRELRTSPAPEHMVESLKLTDLVRTQV